MEYLPRPTGCSGRPRRAADHRRRASTSSSSAAATPAPTASARAPPGRGLGHQLEIMPRPPDARAATNPWPTVADCLPRVARARGGRRAGVRVNTERFVGDDDGNVRGLRVTRSRWSTGGSRRSRAPSARSRAELVLLAMGFVGPSARALLEQLGVELDARGNVARDKRYMSSGRRRLRRRRHGSRAVAHRVGHRRGPRRARPASTPGCGAASATLPGPDPADGAAGQR